MSDHGDHGNAGAQAWPASEEAPEERPDLLIDPVTDLPTVPLLLERMREQLESRGSIAVLAVNILQRGDAEQVTGWQAFDNIIHDVGRFLTSIQTIHLRKEDFVSEVMISGNAFIILLGPPRHDRRLEYGQLCKIRERLHGRLRRFLARRLPAEISGRFDCYVGASLVQNDPQVRSDRLIYRALDEAQADTLSQRRRAGQRYLDALREVLAYRLIHAVYQPVVDLTHRRILGWEALSRPANGVFESIDQVFKAAYEAESVWPLERLCRQRAMEGLPTLAEDQLLFLNIEPDSIYDPQFRSEKTLELLQEASLTPERVVLEMTEHSAVRDFTTFRQTLKYFRTLGFRLAIDDMGSGYSALASVAEIQPEFVKIDMSLTRDLHKRPIKKELVETINRFSRKAGIRVVAEGIEQPEEVEALCEMGIELVQGFYFARPSAPPPSPDIRKIMEDLASPRRG